ncbi:MAG: outer membrane protein assembly factor BamD [Myxococcota bacterium]
MPAVLLLRIPCALRLALATSFVALVSLPELSNAQPRPQDAARRGAEASTKASEGEGYAQQAERAYKSAEKAFRSKDFLEAIRRYNIIRTKFPYSRFAKLADLRIADAYFEQEKYATAVEQYRNFTKLYPDHRQVTYAAWRVALSFYEQMPDDYWPLPPGYERDLARARDAEREVRYFMRRYPDTEYSEGANAKLLEIRRRLADHEFYVATFYLKLENPRAAALRLTYLLQNYSGLGLDPNALFLLARSYLELKDVGKAVRALTDLVEVHPKHPLAADARRYMRRHGLKPAARRAAAPTPDR